MLSGVVHILRNYLWTGREGRGSQNSRIAITVAIIILTSITGSPDIDVAKTMTSLIKFRKYLVKGSLQRKLDATFFLYIIRSASLFKEECYKIWLESSFNIWRAIVTSKNTPFP